MSWPPRPVICCTADTRPAANSPCPATMARGPSTAAASLTVLLLLLPLLALLIVTFEISGDIALPAHLTNQTLVEPFGGIDAAVFEEMVHRDHLGDNRDVLAGIERD